MGQAFESMSEKHIAFLQAQPCFFVATAAADGRVNISPKGFDSLRVLSPTRVMWLNITGSGNETAAHIRELPRMTLWPAFQTCQQHGRFLIWPLIGCRHLVVPVFLK